MNSSDEGDGSWRRRRRELVARGFLLSVSLAWTTVLLAGATSAAGQELRTTANVRDVRLAVAAAERVSAVRWLADFRDLLRIPNVARDSDANRADLARNAEWITRYIGRRGFSSEVVLGATGFPYILASRMAPGAQRTVLIYAHFDGQPVAPENWATPPFEPTLKDGAATLDWDEAMAGPISPEWRLYARSAGDDKAPVIALMAALDALEHAGLAPTVHVKLILDGEEEAGSPALEGVLADHAAELDADLLLFCDGPMHQSRRRQLVFGVRGSMTVDLTAYGATRPLHSGHYGNWAPHPTDALMRLLVTLKDETGAIQVPAYLDEVRPISDAERSAVAAMPRIDLQLRDELSLGRVEGDGRRLEELVMEPAIVVKGFQAGGVGAASRNIILPSATASLNLRLVPDQTPAGVERALRRHFEAQGFHLVDQPPSPEVLRAHPKVLQVEVRAGGYPAFRSPLDSPVAQRLGAVLAELEGQPPLLTPTMGGSLPIYLFERALDMPIIILPIANHDNNQHGRDENLRLGNLFDAVAVYAAVLTQLGLD